MNKPLDDALLRQTDGQPDRQPDRRPDDEARWQNEYAAQMGDEPVVRNRSGVAIKPLYTPGDWSGERYASEVGYPGAPPYTRGIYASMHRGRTWTQRQLIGLGTPPDYNARLLDLVAQGAGAVSLIPCNSVFRGYDMDEVDIQREELHERQSGR